MKNAYLLIGLSCIAFAACHTGSDKQKNSYPLYADYKIWGEEGKENITALFQFKPAAASARTVKLVPPGRVILDGEAIAADSAGFTGVYYEIQKPLEAFAGKHTIVFTDEAGRQYREDFSFTPFSLETTIPATTKRQDMPLQLKGINSGDIIRVVMIDTSFTTTDINKIDTVKNGGLVITRKQLINIAPGPVTLQLFKEQEQPIKSAAGKGGHLSITYSITRDFDLID